MSTDEPDAKASQVHPQRHLAYMRPDATMTLREGLDEYYASIPGLIPTDGESEKDHLFLFHDTCHVLFGCDTSIHGESLVDTWSIFGTTVTLKIYQQYLKYAETQSIFESMTFTDLMKALGESTTAMPQAFWRATHMKKKWPFKEHEPYMDRPLNELREEFGIEVIE